METPDLSRRDFHRLTMAAVGGILAGSVSGCGEQSAPPGGGKSAGTPLERTSATLPGDATDPAGAIEGAELAAVGIEKHVCRGLNACKNQGGKGENDCAGQGGCATIEHHTCGGLNLCKGQGGCGPTAVTNDCAGKGGCHMPLMDDSWKKARAIFESRMKSQGKEFGMAPAKAG